MKSRIQRLKKIGLSLLRPKAILVGIAVFNFSVFYVQSKIVEGWMFCYGAPWYAIEEYRYFPFPLLIATLGLYLGRWWSYLLAIMFCAPVLFQLVLDFLMLPSLGIWFWNGHEPGLGFQYVLALTVSTFSLIGLARTLTRRMSPLA